MQNCYFGNEVLSIFPNPAQNVININLNGDIEQVINTTIVDLFGRNIHQSSVYQSTVNIENFEEGIYFLQLMLKTGNITRKFIISKWFHQIITPKKCTMVEKTIKTRTPKTQSFQRFNHQPISHPQTRAIPYIWHIPIQMFVFVDVVSGHEYTDTQSPPRNVIHQTPQNHVAKWKQEMKWLFSNLLFD